MYSRAELAADFRRLGVEAGDIVMLHASVRAVGEVAGGPDQIHLALRDALTPAGTLLMYASCPAYADEIGRGHLAPAQEQELLEKLPAFDPLTARSARDNGALVECFRTYPGTRASDHVVRFVAAGAQADTLLAPQPWDFSYGAGSPLERFVRMHGRILLLGCDHDHVTFLHHAEHIVDVPDKIVATYQVPIVVDGRRVWREMREVDTSERAHPSWPDRFFARIVDTHLEETGNEGGTVGDATAHLIDAPALLDAALTAMRAVAADAGAADRLLIR